MSWPGGPDAPGSGTEHRGGPDEPPPILGRWSRLYLLVVLELVVIIVLLDRLTRAFD